MDRTAQTTDQGKALGFRVKIVLLCISIAVIASALHGWIFYRDIAALSRQRAVEILGAETQLNGERLMFPFRQMQRDASVLAATSAVEALLRIQSGRVSEVDGKDIEDWSERLKTIFRAQLAIRPDYLQVRLIGMPAFDREIGRIVVEDGRAPAAKTDELLPKGQEPYMRPLHRDDPPRTAYFSELTRNREYGRVLPDAPWTLRLVHPLSGPDGQLVGAIVIHSDYEALLARADLKLNPDGVVVVSFGKDPLAATILGGEIASEAKRVAAKRLAPTNAGEPVDAFDGMLMSSSPDWTRVSLSQRLPSAEGVHDVTIASILPTPVLMHSAKIVLQHQLVLIVLVLAVTAAFASHFGLRLARPLTDLTDRIVQRRDGRIDLVPQMSAKDEIGRLARAFVDMSNELIIESERTARVFEHAVEGLLTTDARGTILSMNPAACRMFGREQGDLVGHSVTRLMPGEFREAHDLAVADLASGVDMPMAQKREVEGQHADGRRFPIEVKFSRVSNAGEGLFVAVIHDISERRTFELRQSRLIEELESSNRRLSRTNAELAAAKSELERSNAELDKFAYVASHDLRAPLRVIDNASRWLEEDLAGFLDDDTRESMQLLRGRVARMERLLQDLLEHSRIGRVSESDAQIDGPELVENILALTGKPKRFTIEVGAGFAGLRLRQFPIQTVLVNLVSNGVKHHDCADGRVTLSVEEAADHYLFEVADDGPGIAPEFHEKVFDMFQTLRPRDAVEGSGMGLAIVRKTVEVAGGAIELVSAPQEGSRFRVTWPKPEPAELTGREAA